VEKGRKKQLPSLMTIWPSPEVNLKIKNRNKDIWTTWQWCWMRCCISKQKNQQQQTSYNSSWIEASSPEEKENEKQNNQAA